MTAVYPLYNPYKVDQLRPICDELEAVQTNYPLIPRYEPPHDLIRRWLNLAAIITHIDLRWATCGHHRLYFTVLYLSFPHLRPPRIRTRTPVLPPHLLVPYQ